MIEVSQLLGDRHFLAKFMPNFRAQVVIRRSIQLDGGVIIHTFVSTGPGTELCPIRPNPEWVTAKTVELY